VSGEKGGGVGDKMNIFFGTLSEKSKSEESIVGKRAARTRKKGRVGTVKKLSTTGKCPIRSDDQGEGKSKPSGSVRERSDHSVLAREGGKAGEAKYGQLGEGCAYLPRAQQRVSKDIAGESQGEAWIREAQNTVSKREQSGQRVKTCQGRAWALADERDVEDRRWKEREKIHPEIFRHRAMAP